MAPTNFKDLTGIKFNRWLVIARLKNNKQGRAMWLCQCDCGNLGKVTTSDLINGKSKSCGCLNIEFIAQLNKTHGKTHTRLFNVWQCMIARCYNANRSNYKNYGGRGITVCDEWKNDFMNFYNWAMQNGYDETALRGKCTIDRINNDGNYEPDNCRWVTLKSQCSNRRTNKFVTYNGVTKTIKQWSYECDIPYTTLYHRVVTAKWDIEKALTTPVKSNKS